MNGTLPEQIIWIMMGDVQRNATLASYKPKTWNQSECLIRCVLLVLLILLLFMISFKVIKVCRHYAMKRVERGQRFCTFI